MGQLPKRKIITLPTKLPIAPAVEARYRLRNSGERRLGSRGLPTPPGPPPSLTLTARRRKRDFAP